MQNPLGRSAAELSSQLSKAIPGVVKYAAAIGLPAGTSDELTAALADVTASDNSYKQGKDDLKSRRQALNIAFKAAAIFCTQVREVVKPALGPRYSQGWDVVGFVGTLQVPTTVDGLLVMLGVIGTYLVGHPEFVRGDDITVLRANTLFADLSTARTAVAEYKANRERLFKARTLKETAARRALRRLLDDLELALGPLDDRWIEFGFNKPGAKETPNVPENITAILIGPNAVALKWPKAPRAEYYRVWKKVSGVDQELIAVGSPNDLDFTLEGLPANATILIGVSAVNNGGESAISELVTIVTH